MPGPRRDGRHIMGKERKGLAAADKRPGPAGYDYDRAGCFPGHAAPGPCGQALEQAGEGGQDWTAGDRVAVFEPAEGIVLRRLGHHPLQGRVGLLPWVAADRGMAPGAVIGRPQNRGADNEWAWTGAVSPGKSIW